MKSAWQRIENNAIFAVPRRRSKPKRTPAANQVKTFDYVHGLLTRKFDRLRSRNKQK